MHKSLVLIDLDDTLWDTWGNNQESLSELYTALDWGRYFVSFEDFFERYYYPINHSLWEQYNRELISKEELSHQRLVRPMLMRLEELRAESPNNSILRSLEALCSEERSYWAEVDQRFIAFVKSKTRLCPGALELLQYLHSKYSVCVLSNGFGELQYAKIEGAGLSPYIDEVILSDAVGYNKPNPLIFAHSLAVMQATAEESIMIGDSWGSDIIGASRAGIDSIWYNRFEIEMPIGDITPPIFSTSNLLDIRTIL